MKKLLVLITILIISASCKINGDQISERDNMNDRIRENIKQYLQSDIAEHQEDIIIDSVIITQIDTLTEYLDSLYSLKMMKHNYKQWKSDQQEMKNEFGDPHPDDFNYEKVKTNELENLEIMANKETDIVVKELKIDDYDSIKTTGYTVRTKLVAHSSKKVNKNFEALFLLDTSYHILEDRMKELGLYYTTAN